MSEPHSETQHIQDVLYPELERYVEKAAMFNLVAQRLVYFLHPNTGRLTCKLCQGEPEQHTAACLYRQACDR